MVKGLLSLYSWKYPYALAGLLKHHKKHSAYLVRYWRTVDFSKLPTTNIALTPKERAIVAGLYGGILAQIIIGIILIGLWYARDLAGGWQFGLAVILAYPIVWAHLVPLLSAMWWLTHPKAIGREIICRLLEAQVQRLRKRNTFSVVGVAGSVGKTSTKIAIANVLKASRRVMWQEGNYNDRVTVPLIFFGHSQPGIFNVFAWTKILLKNEMILRKPYPYQVVVVELGTDGPGQIAQFAYIKPELVVVTAVTPEHMEYFGTLDAVAQEELSALHFAQQALVNIDDTPKEYLDGRSCLSYGLTKKAAYHVTERKNKGTKGQHITFHLGKKATSAIDVPLLGDQGAKIALAAAAAAHILGVPQEDIKKGVATIGAFAGRMQILAGIQNSTIIDDTYNSSPVAAKAALDVLQGGDAPQRIAIMGSMNELGYYSPEAHREVGEHCDPTKLDWVIALGPDAKKYLAPIAKERGCQVKSFLDPYKAGRFAKKQLKDGAVILAKGSQNQVFAEEAIKILLANKEDEAKLVRQSAYWMSVKAKQFKS